MKALILKVNRENWQNTKGYQFANIEEPRIGDSNKDKNAVIVAPILAGVCGTDKGIWHRKAFREPILHALEEDHREYRVAGHEVLGRVVEVGEHVKADGKIHIGEIVTMESHLFCGECSACTAGDQHVCLNEKIIGVTADGGFAERIKVPAKVLWPTNLEKIRPEIAAIQEPFGNAVHACAPFPGVSVKGKNVAIFGCGTIGLFSVLIARGMGAKKIIGIEPNQSNKEKALRCGADKVISPSEHSAEEVKDFFREGAGGADFCLEMSGFPSSIVQAVKAAGNGGSIVLFGLASGDLVIPSFEEFIVKGKRIYSVVGRRLFSTWDITKRLLEDSSNGIQEKIWEVLLEKGNGTILDISSFDSKIFEESMQKYTKTLLRISH